jgi:hypothetical protein
MAGKWAPKVGRALVRALTLTAKAEKVRSREFAGGSELGSGVHGGGARERHSREREEASEGKWERGMELGERLGALHIERDVGARVETRWGTARAWPPRPEQVSPFDALRRARGG